MLHADPTSQTQDAMPKKGKKKKEDDDDWEAEADVIAMENLSVVKGAALEALFADLIAEGSATEAELDRATDQLASGTKTEDELIAEWKAKVSFDKAYGFGDREEGGSTDAPEGKDGQPGDDKSQRRWRKEDGVHKVAALPEATDEEVHAKHVELFGEAGSAKTPLMGTADGVSERERVGLSEGQLDEWRRAAHEPLKPMPLPAMTAVCLLGPYGVSVHADRFVRLWDGATGRRLAAHQHKLDLTCIAADSGIVAVGDSSGAVHVYGTETDFLPLRLPPPKQSTGAVHAVAVVPQFERGAALIVSSDGGGLVTAACAATEPWPPTQMSCVDLPFSAALGSSAPVSLASGTNGKLFGCSGGSIALLDVTSAVPIWNSRGGGWAGDDVSWSATMASIDAAACPLHAFKPSRAADAAKSVIAAAAKSPLAPAAAAAVDVSTDGPEQCGGGTVRAGSSNGSDLWPGRRLLSYSQWWHLLASADAERGVVALWDARQPGDRGPAAAMRMAGGVRSLHLDEGQGMAGHLIVAPSSGAALELYDVRRVPAARAHSAALPLATLPLPQSKGGTHEGGVACFAALGSSLVFGCGAESSEAWRLTGEPTEEGDEEEQEQRDKKKDKKKKRIVGKDARMFNRTK